MGLKAARWLASSISSMPLNDYLKIAWVAELHLLLNLIEHLECKCRPCPNPDGCAVLSFFDIALREDSAV